MMKEQSEQSRVCLRYNTRGMNQRSNASSRSARSKHAAITRLEMHNADYYSSPTVESQRHAPG